MSEAATVSPCRFPRCRDKDGNPRLTSEPVFCLGCQSLYRKLLGWLVLDFLALRQFPSPARIEGDGSKHQEQKSKSFGHPAEWASDTMSEIAQSLNWAEDGLRDELGHEPPIHPYASEVILIRSGFNYLSAQFQRLCTYSAAEDTAIEFDDLHRKIRRKLGHTRYVQRLPTPCPWCDVAALVRSVGQIDCGECGKSIADQHYEWFANLVLDAMIDAYDTRASVNA